MCCPCLLDQIQKRRYIYLSVLAYSCRGKNNGSAIPPSDSKNLSSDPSIYRRLHAIRCYTMVYNGRFSLTIFAEDTNALFLLAVAGSNIPLSTRACSARYSARRTGRSDSTSVAAAKTRIGQAAQLAGAVPRLNTMLRVCSKKRYPGSDTDIYCLSQAPD